MNKKQIGLIALMIFAIAGILQAQSLFPELKNLTVAEREKLDKVYTISLNSQNKGVVEAALAVVTMIKLDVPEAEFPMIREQIEYLINHSDTPMIRYRASLAGAVFDNPEMFKDESVHLYSDPADLFSALDNASNKPLLTVK
jgi:hypothetical protein